MTAPTPGPGMAVVAHPAFPTSTYREVPLANLQEWLDQGWVFVSSSEPIEPIPVEPLPAPVSTAQAMAWFRDELIGLGFSQEQVWRSLDVALAADVRRSGLNVADPNQK